jgi:hypothetical protein
MWMKVNEYIEVSIEGEVRSISRKVKIKNNKTRKVNGKILQQNKHHNGYMKISTKINGKPKTYLVHRLVANAFIANPNNKNQVNHIDGDKSNNHKNNLEWVTQSENQKHAYKTNLQPCTFKINQDIRNTIRLLYPYISISNDKIGELFNVKGTTIHNIVKDLK